MPVVFLERSDNKVSLWDQITSDYDPKNPYGKIWNKPYVWVKMVEEALNGCNKVLDVGCGAGYIAVPLAERFKVHGSDFSKGMLNLAVKRARESNLKINFTHADSHLLPFDDDFFDAAYCRFALWPLKYPEKALKEMVRVVKPGGRVVIVEVDREKKFNKHKISLKGKLILLMSSVIKRNFKKQKETKKVWKEIVGTTRSNPLVNLKIVKDILEKQGCIILSFDRKIQEKTCTFFGRLMASEFGNYFLCAAQKGE